MDPVLDGTGGGFGKHKGLPVREVLGIFDRAAERPSMRSVRTIIRVGREQVEARGHLDVNGRIAIGAFVLAGIAAIVWWARVPVLVEKAPVATAVCAAIGGLMGFGSYTTRHERRANVAQEKMIRDHAITSLTCIVESPEFAPDELDWSERNALVKLAGRRKAPL